MRCRWNCFRRAQRLRVTCLAAVCARLLPMVVTAWQWQSYHPRCVSEKHVSTVAFPLDWLQWCCNRCANRSPVLPKQGDVREVVCFLLVRTPPPPPPPPLLPHPLLPPPPTPSPFQQTASTPLIPSPPHSFLLPLLCTTFLAASGGIYLVRLNYRPAAGGWVIQPLHSSTMQWEMHSLDEV